MNDKTVLILDDDALILKSLGIFLNVNGFESRGFEAPAQFLDYFEKNPSEPVLIMLDYMLPEMDGLTVFDRVRLINPDIPVVMSSSFDKAELVMEFIQRGGDGFISKPVMHREIFGFEINRAIEHKSRVHELEAARAAKIAAESTQRMEREFLANMSHELRTPAQIIQTTLKIVTENLGKLQVAVEEARRDVCETGEIEHACQLLDEVLAPLSGEDDFSPKKLALLASDIAEASQATLRLRSTINNVLDLAKLSSGKVEFNIGEYDLAGVIRSVKTAFKKMAEEKGIRFITPAEIKPLMANFDRTWIEQVFANIVSNAIKYTEQGGEILIDLYESGQEAGFSVMDTGIGIPNGEEESIFDRFKQSSRSEKSQGTGLGLAICHEVVTRHGGRIWAEKNPGGGTIVRVVLGKAIHKEKHREEKSVDY